MLLGLVLVLSSISISSAKTFYFTPNDFTYRTGALAYIWESKANWATAQGRPRNSVPGVGDNVFIGGGMPMSNCNSGVMIVSTTTRVNKLTIGKPIANCNTCIFALLVNGNLTAQQILVQNNAELRLGVYAVVTVVNSILVLGGGYLGGSGIINTPLATVNGVLNPYDETGLQQDFYNNSVSHATQSTSDDPQEQSYGVAGQLAFTGSLTLVGATVQVDLGGYDSFDTISVAKSLKIEQSSIALSTTVDGDLSYRIFVGDMTGGSSGEFTVQQTVFGGSFYKRLVTSQCATAPEAGHNPQSTVPGLYSGGEEGVNHTDAKISKRGLTGAVVCTSQIGLGILLTSRTCPTVCPSSYSAPPDCSVASCPFNCNNFGTCKGYYPLTPQCVCNAGHTGSFCGTAVCPGNGVCNGHGTCMPGGSSPYCLCSSNWAGVDCSIPLCPKGCSGHGTCIGGNNQNPYCNCDTFYDSKPDCSSYIPPCETECENRSTCVNGKCKCTAQFTGPSCQIPVCNPKCGEAQCVSDGSSTYCSCPGTGAPPAGGKCMSPPP